MLLASDWEVASTVINNYYLLQHMYSLSKKNYIEKK
jgi:hypothetical protein